MAPITGSPEPETHLPSVERALRDAREALQRALELRDRIVTVEYELQKQMETSRAAIDFSRHLLAARQTRG